MPLSVEGALNVFTYFPPILKLAHNCFSLQAMTIATNLADSIGWHGALQWLRHPTMGEVYGRLADARLDQDHIYGWNWPQHIGLCCPNHVLSSL